jgi:hypothetical protein
MPYRSLAEHFVRRLHETYLKYRSQLLVITDDADRVFSLDILVA